MDALPRVLVADDQADVAVALSLLLRREGFVADTAASVDEVRRRLSARPYDLLLMDLNYARDTTSGHEGLELLTEVHARDAALPVIVMTGWGSIDTAVEAMRRGARTFVHKPWDNAQLAETIRREVCDGQARRTADSCAARERDDAQRIQRALLPSAMPSVAWGSMAASWTPASTCGGDCYDFLPLADGHIGLSIADVSGKGLPAALLMAHLQASVRAYAEDGLGPAQLAARANASLCHAGQSDRFVTFFYAEIDGSGRSLTYCNAGHNAPVLVHGDGTSSRLQGGGMVLGVTPEALFVERRVPLSAGDRLVLFTDGITEVLSCDGSGEDFGESRLVDLVRERRQDPAPALVAAILATVAQFAGGPCTDDATVVVAALCDDGTESSHQRTNVV